MEIPLYASSLESLPFETGDLPVSFRFWRFCCRRFSDHRGQLQERIRALDRNVSVGSGRFGACVAGRRGLGACLVVAWLSVVRLGRGDESRLQNEIR